MYITSNDINRSNNGKWSQNRLIFVWRKRQRGKQLKRYLKISGSSELAIIRFLGWEGAKGWYFDYSEYEPNYE